LRITEPTSKKIVELQTKKRKGKQSGRGPTAENVGQEKLVGRGKGFKGDARTGGGGDLTSVGQKCRQRSLSGGW